MQHDKAELSGIVFYYMKSCTYSNEKGSTDSHVFYAVDEHGQRYRIMAFDPGRGIKIYPSPALASCGFPVDENGLPKFKLEGVGWDEPGYEVTVE